MIVLLNVQSRSGELLKELLLLWHIVSWSLLWSSWLAEAVTLAITMVVTTLSALAIATLAATTVITTVTASALATATVVTTLTTLRTVASWTTLRLYIALWLLGKGAH